MSLAVDYRPKNFEEVMGNESTVKALQAMLGREKAQIPHAFMFNGPSGCGKTTLGRIVAGELGCKGQDYYELDTADFRGIDTVRDIRTKMRYSPTEGTSRVFLLDECHKLTNDAQNALLKALEDAPAHVYFILATTDPQKLLPTIRGRCVPFDVQPLTEKHMLILLKEIAEEEGKEVRGEVLEQIVDNCLGSPRNALQILEKVIDLDPREQRRAALRVAEEQNAVIDLCRLLMKTPRPNWLDVARVLQGLAEAELETIRLAVLGYCASVLLKGDNPQAYLIMDSFREPWYNNGRSGLVLAAYEVFNA
jgi:DNA polymerase III delta prime subunit